MRQQIRDYPNEDKRRLSPEKPDYLLMAIFFASLIVSTTVSVLIVMWLAGWAL